MPVSKRYQQHIARGEVQADPAQQAVLAEFDRIINALPLERPSSGRLSRWRRQPASEPVRGVYLWGSVGRGKTWLVDLFFETLPIADKTRLHFHRFMRHVHDELTRNAGRKNPLQHVAAEFARHNRVLLLDEFFVNDIGDAVILAGLLRALFDHGVTLVTTSNTVPENLYKNGIQRASFLPAIDLLNRYTAVVELGGERDYRRQVLEAAPIYHHPLSPAADAAMAEEFKRLAAGEIERDGVLHVMGRDIPFRMRAGDLVWFDFDRLCGPPRSQNDYIEVATCHHTVFISDIPRLDGTSDDRSRRFVFLIDEFYDRKVKVVISADAPADRLYCGERLAFEFQRTASRLQEMQTHDYLGALHIG